MFAASSSQMKQIDARAINDYGIPEIVLMENAANAVLNHLKTLNIRKVIIICGGGNNGGDGFALARHLYTNGYSVKVYCFIKPEKMSPAAVINQKILLKIGIAIHNNIDSLIRDTLVCDLVVDAIFGTGLKGEIRGIYNDIIDIVNECGKHIVSIDIPSGIDSDTGERLGRCIYADETITFCCNKLGHLLNEGRQASGKVHINNISIPEECILEQEIKTTTFNGNYPLNLLKRRLADSNKGDYGKLYIIGGSFEMSGAVALSAKAALRSGAGLVTCVIPKVIIDRVGSLVPEATFLSCEDSNGKIDISYEKLDIIMTKADVIAIGPGIGIDLKLQNMLEYILEKWNKPLIIDADALNMLSNIKECLKNTAADVILTPHPGEMNRLSGYSISDINDKRLQIAMEFADEYNCTVLLKGSSTVVSDGVKTYINTTGNPGMACGGSGDVLTGIVASLAGQGYNTFESCIIGACIHGLAGDEAYKNKGNGLIASDIADYIGKNYK